MQLKIERERSERRNGHKQHYSQLRNPKLQTIKPIQPDQSRYDQKKADAKVGLLKISLFKRL
jgi:hypothetical protein